MAVESPVRRLPGYAFLRPWLTTTDHIHVGLLYVFTSLLFLVLSGAAALLIRLQLAQPEGTVVGADTFNALFTFHGLSMVFPVGMALITGIFNIVIPLQIGAKDLPFPRINALSFWLLAAGSAVYLLPFLTGRGPDLSWTLYPPYTTGVGAGLARPAAELGLIAVVLWVGSSVLSAVNFLTMILRNRVPTMGLMKMPLFTWGALSIFAIGLFIFPVLLAALTMQYLDLAGLTGFFNPALGGDPVLYQHLFWFWGHPEVYVLVIPGWAAVLEVIPVFARRPIYGYKAIVGSLLTIVVLGMLVWTHHMYTTTVPLDLRWFQMVLTHLVSVPTGVIILCMLATLWGGSIRLKTPMLFALGSVGVFTIGGITGMFLATIPLDIALQDTYFVVAHFHFTLIGGTVLGLLAGLYYWLPRLTGRMLSETLGRLHFLLSALGFFLAFWPLHYVGLAGMPRRVATYPADAGWGPLNTVSTVGALVMGFAQLFLIINLLKNWKKGPEAGSNPWHSSAPEWPQS